MHRIFAIRVSQVDHTGIEHPEKLNSLLAIGQADVFVGHDWAVQNPLAANEVKTMVAEIGEPLAFIPCDHFLSVSTKSSPGKGPIMFGTSHYWPQVSSSKSDLAIRGRSPLAGSFGHNYLSIRKNLLGGCLESAFFGDRPDLATIGTGPREVIVHISLHP